MSKLGIKRRGIAYNDQNKADTVNLAGGTAHTIESPSQRLLHIVGSPGFNEPRAFYQVPEHNPRNYVAKLKDLAPQARMIVEVAKEVARSESPRDLLAIAAFLRNEAHCRQTPLVLLAVAAHCDASRSMVREYAPKIIRRADELMGAYGAYRYLFGKPMPSALLKGIRDSFGNFDEYQLMKYNQPGNTPSMKDVLLQMPDRKPGTPVSRGMAEFIINGKLVDKNGVDHGDTAPRVRAYLEFLDAAKASDRLTPELVELADEGRATWETIVSMFGPKKEVWQSVLPRMGYMAVLRNVRNLLQAGVDADEFCGYIENKNAVLKSKQYPFRFLSAFKELEKTPGVDHRQRARVLNAVSQALDISVENVGKVPGSTLILVDNSGSMSWTRPSSCSSLSVAEIANCLSALLAKACDEAYIYAWASTFALIDVMKNDSVLGINEKIQRANVGGATYAYKPLADATQQGLFADRIVLLSDMQCYHNGAKNFQDVLSDYRRKVNQNVWLHSINLNAMDVTAQAASGRKRVNLVSGFSDKILATLMEAENGSGGIPTLEYVRKNY